MNETKAEFGAGDQIKQKSYECKVYAANNLHLTTKTRMEHLSEKDREALQNSKSSQFPNVPSFITRLKATFGNIHGTYQPVKNVTAISSKSINNPKDVMCIVDESFFAVPWFGLQIRLSQVDKDEDLILLQYLKFCLFLDFKIKLILFMVLWRV